MKHLVVRHVRATGSYITANRSAHQFAVLGSGIGRSPDEASTSARWEAYERAAAHAWDASLALWSSESRLRDQGLAFKSCARLTRQGGHVNGLATVSHEVRQPWIVTRSLITDEQVLIPASLIWMGAGLDAEIPRQALGTSNGLAAGRDLSGATTTAVLELCERDAVLAWWWGLAPSHEISQNCLALALKDFRCDVGDNGASEIRAHVIEHVPGILAVAVALRVGTAVAAGFGAGTDAAAALRHALREALGGIAQYSADGHGVLSPSHVASLRDRQRLYCRSGTLIGEFDARRSGQGWEADALDTAAAVTRAAQREATVDTIRDVLSDNGIDVHVAVLALTEKAAVVRAVSDGLVPLNVHPREQATGIWRHGVLHDFPSEVDDARQPHPIY